MSAAIEFPVRHIRRAALAALALIAFLPCIASAQRHRSSSSHHRSSSGTVHVRSYTRKDGTHVSAYDRSSSRTAAPRSETPRSTVSRSSGSAPHRSPAEHAHVRSSYMRGESPRLRTYRRNYVADGVTADRSVRRDKHGRIKRSSSAKRAFERQMPCPSTGKVRGGCPGYIVDHVRPLECGGADAPSNMQWQTVAAAKAKDKTEGSCWQ